jgi:hypothetical protein
VLSAALAAWTRARVGGLARRVRVWAPLSATRAIWRRRALEPCAGRAGSVSTAELSGVAAGSTRRGATRWGAIVAETVRPASPSSEKMAMQSVAPSSPTAAVTVRGWPHLPCRSRGVIAARILCRLRPSARGHLRCRYPTMVPRGILVGWDTAAPDGDVTASHQAPAPLRVANERAARARLRVEPVPHLPPGVGGVGPHSRTTPAAAGPVHIPNAIGHRTSRARRSRTSLAVRFTLSIAVP